MTNRCVTIDETSSRSPFRTSLRRSKSVGERSFFKAQTMSGMDLIEYLNNCTFPALRSYNFSDDPLRSVRHTAADRKNKYFVRNLVSFKFRTILSGFPKPFKHKRRTGEKKAARKDPFVRYNL